jgi:hypothetical protein
LFSKNQAGRPTHKAKPRRRDKVSIPRLKKFLEECCRPNNDHHRKEPSHVSGRTLAMKQPGAEEVQALFADEMNDVFVSSLSLFELAGVLKRTGAARLVPVCRETPSDRGRRDCGIRPVAGRDTRSSRQAFGAGSKIRGSANPASRPLSKLPWFSGVRLGTR